MFFPLFAAAVAQQPANVLLPHPTKPAIQKPAPSRKAPNDSQVMAQGNGEPIRTITFEGVEAPAEVASAATAFLGRPATHDTLVELAGALSKAYERTDVALYTVSIADQDFKDGVVVVDLVEGWVDAVRIGSKNESPFPLLKTEAENVVGQKPLSRRRYERQSALIQSIPGITVAESFENPEGDDSVAWVLTPRQRRAEFAFAVNNRGPHLLGDLVLNAGADFYRLLTDGDQLSFTASATPSLKNYRALETSYSLPIGTDGLRLTGSAATARTRARHIDIKGRARLASLALNYPILRTSRNAADIGLGIDGLNSRNALFGNIFATERIRAARLSGTFVSASAKHNLTANAILSKGLGLFDARSDIGETGFVKLSGSATYERLLAPRFLGRINVTGQLTSDRLPASELFSIGGPLIGRAFDTGLLTGDRGVGGFAELAYRPVTAGAFNQSELYLFIDHAKLTVLRRDLSPRQSFSLGSAGGGVRLRYKDKVQLGLEAAAVLNRPYPAYTDDWRLSAYYSITF